ncbi:MAG TPA: aldehyde ferredoxin oxidoreductase family protein [Candidatus Ozemobacteraceae bacterium]|nr:aldehyde ferredoxin oxidoreductase family protein [Candidatus Ozemobacteraceae bacterium]
MAYAGTYLRVNLSNGTIATAPLDPDLARRFLGGRGLATKLFCDEVDPGIDPFSPDNKLIFATGPLSGTTAPTGGRYMVVTKSPLTGTIASSNSGGFFGAHLKFAGYDLIVFEGRAATPVYLSILDSGVTLKDATPLWGKTVSETTDALVAESGVSDARVACIGPAGENLCLMGAIINDKGRAAGRSGVGAVMGSKNLKAIVVGTAKKRPAPADEAAFKAAVQESMKRIKADPVTSQGLPAFGTKVLDNIINSSGMYPCNNFQTSSFPDVEEVCGEALVEKGYLKRKKGCFGCPIACGRDVTLPNGMKGEGPEYESGWSFGALCGVNDLIAITEANFLCNEMGLDTISMGVTLAAAMELREKGLIGKDELGKGPDLKFGSSEAILFYTRATAFKQGFGAKLAQGSWRLANGYGHPELSMSVKKQELPAYDPRGVQGQGLAFATSNRGGCHVRAYLIALEVLSHPQPADPQEILSKPTWVKAFQDLTAVIDSAGMCLFTSFALGMPEYTALINAATGWHSTPEQMMAIGERIWNLERQFNLRAGLTAADDTLPPRLLEVPIAEGPNKGRVVRLSELLPAYYRVRGWGNDGVPTPEKLTELGL